MRMRPLDRNGWSCMAQYDLILRKSPGQCHIWHVTKSSNCRPCLNLDVYTVDIRVACSLAGFAGLISSWFYLAENRVLKNEGKATSTILCRKRYKPTNYSIGTTLLRSTVSVLDNSDCPNPSISITKMHTKAHLTQVSPKITV